MKLADIIQLTIYKHCYFTSGTSVKILKSSLENAAKEIEQIYENK